MVRMPMTTASGTIVIRPAVAAERQALEALQLRASLHSGRWTEHLRAHPDAIQIPAEHIERGLVRVAERDGAPAGFATLLPPVNGVCELDAIFVEPAAMGTGIGRRLIDDAVVIARRSGAASIVVVANPDAFAFYERLGFSGEQEVATRFGAGRHMHRDIEAEPAPRRLSETDRATAQRLIDEIDRFNVETTGLEEQEFLVSETGDGGELVGGAYGWTWGATCWIEALWVRADARHGGVGSRLLRATEQIARERGCVQLALDTHSFQAPGFYAKHGFEVVGQVPDYPAGHDDFLMRKRLDEPARGRAGAPREGAG
jgi:ribosomal protein S18 acetylase RimI-like enzyme